MIKSNIHTHSFYCGHGHGEISEYVREAERLGLDVLGFSEHLPLPDGLLGKTRMANSLMPDYEADVRREQKEAKLSVLLGYETDYYPEYLDYVKTISTRVDYLTFGIHYVRCGCGLKTPFSDRLEPADLILYGRQFADAVETGLFAFAAHPDLFINGYARWDREAEALSRDLIRLSVKYRLPLEINGNGILKCIERKKDGYPYVPFWRMAADEGAIIIAGFDAHEIVNLERAGELLEDYIKTNGFEIASISAENGRPVFKTGRER